MWRAYPLAADRNRTPGVATIGCHLTSNGELSGCKVQNESPTDAGFGREALSLFRSFRVQTGGKSAVELGREVTATVDFTPRDFVRLLPSGSGEGSPGVQTLVRFVWNGFYTSYPFQARFSGVSGWVHLRCPVERGGVVPRCAVVEEQPKNLGFGEAALQGMHGVLVSSKTVDGRGTEGMILDTTEVINPSCDELPAWDVERAGCTAGSQPFPVLPGH